MKRKYKLLTILVANSDFKKWQAQTLIYKWSFGTTRFNILMLGVVHDGVAHPLLWEMRMEER